MNTKEFYEMLKEFAKKEMMEQGKKAAESKDYHDYYAHVGASNEAAKFYQMIEMSWVDVEN